MAAKKIPLSTWAAENYNPPPSAYLLRKWMQSGEIYPAPELVGKTYYVASTATRGQAAARPTLVDRLKRAA